MKTSPLPSTRNPALFRTQPPTTAGRPGRLTADRRPLTAAVILWMLAPAAPGASLPPAPVPASPYLAVVYRYADAMLEHGRDTFGPVQTGLFLSALDRTTMKPLTNHPAPPAGIREGDRAGLAPQPLTGANPQHDENLLRLLYTLSGLSGDARYRTAADTALKWFLEHAASTNTDLLPWGEHMAWDVLADQPIPPGPNARHEFFRPWLLWDRCLDLAPDATHRFALGLWNYQIANRATGAFDRHAGYWTPAPTDGMDFPRHAGFYLRTWAAAFARTHDPALLEAMEVVLGRFERKRHPQTGWIELRSGQPQASPPSTLSLAIDCDGAARHVPEALALRLTALAEREDELFCTLPHPLETKGGFVVALDRQTGRPELEPTPLWTARYGAFTTAQVGMMCVARYDNSGQVAYRRLISAAADAYLQSLPDEAHDTWPMTLGHAISLQLAAWRHTTQPQYLERARQLADFAVARFWTGQPLPRASLQTDHYESITGPDTLALALVELHLQILHITAVRCPPNTIDR